MPSGQTKASSYASRLRKPLLTISDTDWAMRWLRTWMATSMGSSVSWPSTREPVLFVIRRQELHTQRHQYKRLALTPGRRPPAQSRARADTRQRLLFDTASSSPCASSAHSLRKWTTRISPDATQPGPPAQDPPASGGTPPLMLLTAQILSAYESPRQDELAEISPLLYNLPV